MCNQYARSVLECGEYQARVAPGKMIDDRLTYKIKDGANERHLVLSVGAVVCGC